MEKLTDQELDSIFKDAAEGIKPEYDVAAWEGMNERLEASAKSPSVLGKWILLSIVGLIIFSSGVWIGYKLRSPSGPEGNKNDGQILVKENTTNQGLPETITSKQSESQTEQPNQNQDSNTLNQVDLALVKEKRVFGNRPSQKDIVTQPSANINPIAMQEIKEPERTIIPDAELMNNNGLGFTQPKNDSIFSEEVKSNHDNDSSAVDLKKDEDSKVQTRGIFIRGLASPDFSSIDFGSSGAAGSNYALLVEYQFTNRWSVSTGAIRSFKKYSSNGEITYSGRTADNLDGACRILDIPLTVYYRMKPSSKTSFFGGVGLSSYLMLSENYTYRVYTNNGDRVYSKQVEKENNEWFKVLNLSVGIQLQLNARLYVQAEPFLKAPLAGMGYGDVRLSSLGVFFGVKYKLN